MMDRSNRVFGKLTDFETAFPTVESAKIAYTEINEVTEEEIRKGWWDIKMQGGLITCGVLGLRISFCFASRGGTSRNPGGQTSVSTAKCPTVHNPIKKTVIFIQTDCLHITDHRGTRGPNTRRKREVDSGCYCKTEARRPCQNEDRPSFWQMASS